MKERVDFKAVLFCMGSATAGSTRTPGSEAGGHAGAAFNGGPAAYVPDAENQAEMVTGSTGSTEAHQLEVRLHQLPDLFVVELLQELPLDEGVPLIDRSMKVRQKTTLRFQQAPPGSLGHSVPPLQLCWFRTIVFPDRPNMMNQASHPSASAALLGVRSDFPGGHGCAFS